MIDGRRCRESTAKDHEKIPFSRCGEGERDVPGRCGLKHLLPGGKASSQEMQERHFPMWNMLKSTEEEKGKGGGVEWLRRCMNIKMIIALNKAPHRGGTITGIVGKPDAQLPLDLMGR